MSETPLRCNEKLRAGYEEARAKSSSSLPAWEDLSEVQRRQWQIELIRAIMTARCFP